MTHLKIKVQGRFFHPNTHTSQTQLDNQNNNIIQPNIHLNTNTQVLQIKMYIKYLIKFRFIQNRVEIFQDQVMTLIILISKIW